MRQQGDAGPPGLMATAATPNEGVTMSIPIHGGLAHGLTDLLPAVETPPLEREGTERFPPGFDQIQVGGVGRLEDELPARMGQGEQEDVGRAVGAQVVLDGEDAHGVARQPGVDALQEVGPVGDGAAGIGLRERVARGRSKGAEDVAFAPSAIIGLLFGAFRGSGAPVGLRLRLDVDEFLAGEAFGRLGTHLVQTDHDTLVRRRLVEGRDGPLFWANAGSTGVALWEPSPSRSKVACSLNQVSCCRQRKPSASSSWSMRPRLIGTPFSSCIYAAKRSNVQHPNGKPKACGLVKAAAITSPITSAVYIGGRPERAASASPSSPRALKRPSHCRTIFSLTPSSRAIAGAPLPARAKATTRARSTSRASAVRDFASRSISATSSAVSARTRIIALPSGINSTRVRRCTT